MKEEVENLQQLTPNIKVAQFYSDFQQFQARLPECKCTFCLLVCKAGTLLVELFCTSFFSWNNNTAGGSSESFVHSGDNIAQELACSKHTIKGQLGSMTLDCLNPLQLPWFTVRRRHGPPPLNPQVSSSQYSCVEVTELQDMGTW